MMDSVWRPRARCLLATLLLLATICGVMAEEAARPQPGATASPGTAAAPGENAAPKVNPYPEEVGDSVATVANPFPVKPYGEEEFPPWLRILRRFEIIAIGSFPIAYLNANLFYDVGRWAYYGISGDATKATQYQPLFFAPADKPQNEYDENLGLVLSSIGLSVGIAVIDLIIGLVQEDLEKKQAAAGAL